MNSEEIFLSYNIDLLLNLYEKLKDNAPYNNMLDMKTNSFDFVDIVVNNIDYIEVHNNDNESGDENEYYNYET